MILLCIALLAFQADRKIIWQDEFSGALNTPPDPAKWTYDIGNGPPPGWGNRELQHYTDSTANAYHDGEGHLVIQALKQQAPDGITYTSARLKTQGKFTFTYGRVEARIKMPYAQGIWPAFWMLGANIRDVGWPKCGEIDVMENFGIKNDDVRRNHGTLHGPGYPGTGITGKFIFPQGQRADDFHIYAIEWRKGSIEFLVDGRSYHKTSPPSMPAGGTWVFDENPMFLLLNLAVGGSPAPVGYPDSTTQFPQQMIVDYIRVYE